MPAGGVAVGEALTHAVQREVREESGLWMAVGEALGAHDVPHPVTNEPRLTVFFHATINCDTDVWPHTVVTSDGDDSALVFECEFRDVKKVELPFQQGEFLSLTSEALRGYVLQRAFKILLTVPPANFTEARTGKSNPPGDSVSRVFD